jgi:hypothetical protein
MAEFVGGREVSSLLERYARNTERAASVKVGFMERATYPDGTSVALVAAVNEFGRPAANQPPRPFFRTMIAAHRDEWPRVVAQLLKQNQFDAARTLEGLGQAMVGELQQSIVNLVDPPLKPTTVERKGFAKPLIDTGHMMRSVDYQVEKGSGEG